MNTAATPQLLSEGQFIQWYRVEKVLGRGGFGITYLATDNNLEHRVALKEYLPAELVERQSDTSLRPVSADAEKRFKEGLDRFLSEARTLVKFRHKNIVRVMTVFEANNTAYLVMEYEEGERFKEAVTVQGGADETLLKSLLLDIIDGLEQVHQHGFIHRDIKPVNIIIRQDGSPVLLDFGASRGVNRDSGTPPTSFVSAGYTPLEQYQEGMGMVLGPWTDIYSLAATLYYAISGRTPVSAVSRLASYVKKSTDPLTPATEVGHGKYSDEFLEAIDWALQFKTEDRPQTLIEWRNAIVNAELVDKTAPRDRSNTIRHAQRVKQADSERRQRIFRWRWLTGAAAVLTALVGWYMFLELSKQREIRVLLRQADKAFVSHDALQEARPLYRQVLDMDPQNTLATARVREIDRLTEAQIVQLISDQRFAAAESVIRRYAAVATDEGGNLARIIAQFRSTLNTKKELKLAQSEFETGHFQDALSRLAVLKQSGTEDEDITSLQQQVKSALNTQAERRRAAEARRVQLEQERLTNQRRLAEANARQRQRRSDYQQYLNNARWALQNDNIVTARKWLDSASAMQINDTQLSELKTRLEAAEAFQIKPLSDYELSYARSRFSALERAIESKNLAAIEDLVEIGSARTNLFKTLFDRYTQITVRIIEVESAVNPKRVTATLRIEKMALPNGDIVYPATSYRDSGLTLERQRFNWSAIQW